LAISHFTDIGFIMREILLVAVGGAFGSVLRYYVGVWSVRIAGTGFPWGTLTVNLVGSFLIGIVVELIVRKFGGSPALRLFLMTGIIGGFTTFSTFALDTVALMERGQLAVAMIYVLTSVLVSLGAVFAGLSLIRALA
jgi:CrcB protein